MRRRKRRKELTIVTRLELGATPDPERLAGLRISLLLSSSSLSLSSSLSSVSSSSRDIKERLKQTMTKPNYK